MNFARFAVLASSLALAPASSAQATDGEPVATGESLAERRFEVDGLACVPLKAVRADAPGIWSADGRFVYLLGEGGIILKISIPELVEERRVRIPGAYRGLAMSKCGLVCYSGKKAREILALDADLKTTRRVAIKEGERLLAARPASSMVFYDESGLVGFDMEKAPTGGGKPPETWKVPADRLAKLREEDADFRDFSSGVLSEDGTVLCVWTSRRIFRVKCDSPELSVEQVSGEYEHLGKPAVSSDAKHVAFFGRSKSWQWGIDEQETVEVFGPDSLRVSVLQFQAFGAVGIDAPRGRIFYGNRGLKELDREGKLTRSTTLLTHESGGKWDWVMVHPSGKFLLISQMGKISLVTLP